MRRAAKSVFAFPRAPTWSFEVLPFARDHRPTNSNLVWYDPLPWISRFIRVSSKSIIRHNGIRPAGHFFWLVCKWRVARSFSEPSRIKALRSDTDSLEHPQSGPLSYLNCQWFTDDLNHWDRRFATRSKVSPSVRPFNIRQFKILNMYVVFFIHF